MKNLNKLLFLLIVLAGCTNSSNNTSIYNERLSELLDAKNFFKLKVELKNNKNNLSEKSLLYYKAQVHTVFLQTKQSSECVDLLLKEYKNQMHDSTIVELLSVESANYVFDYKYKEAAELFKVILEEYNAVLDSSDMENYRNNYQLFGTLEAIKPQVIHKNKTYEILSYRNRFNHQMIPVQCGGEKGEFVFDSGANLSGITESFAKKMNLTILESNVSVGSSTEIETETKLAVADSFYVGDILFENVVFLVFPDEQLSFPSHNYEINGIIGFPVMYQMGEIRMHNDGSMIIPKKSDDRQLQNMFMNGLNPVVLLLSDGDTLFFTMDTGAKVSELSKKYYEEHKEMVEEKGTLTTSQRSGVGGTVEGKEFVLHNFPYTIGSKSNVLPEIPVVLTEYSFSEDFDGNLGQDVFSQFNEMILNFQYMYVDFE